MSKLFFLTLDSQNSITFLHLHPYCLYVSYEHLILKARSMEESMPSIKIVVVGETSVGKTTLIQSLSNSNVKQIGPTQGCHIEIIKRCYNGTPVFIELWDIGGWSKFKNCRQVFYDSVDGIMF